MLSRRPLEAAARLRVAPAVRGDPPLLVAAAVAVVQQHRGAVVAAVVEHVEAEALDAYGAVARRIVEVGTKERVNLIERLAGMIAQTLLREFPAREVRVRVRKLTPPLQGLVGTPAVELVRSR